MPRNNKKKINFVAEIGCNHQGNFKLALKMIDELKNFCNIDFVKLQKRNNKELLNKDKYNSPHPVPKNSFGKTYGEHREKLEFTFKQHNKIMKYCEKLKMTSFTSVWDLSSAKEIVKLKPKHVKVPSACNNNWELLKFIFKKYKCLIHISLGMTTKLEEKKIVSLAKRYKANKRVVLYACTSDYPVQPDSICLLEITNLIKKYGNIVKAIGFSGHHHGISADIAAATLGATWIERHFTLDRTMKGTDHAASLEPDGARRLKRDLDLLSQTLKFKPNEILTCEKVQRQKLKFRS